MPKRPIYIMFFLVALAVGVRLAGPSVLKEFGTIFTENESTRRIIEQPRRTLEGLLGLHAEKSAIWSRTGTVATGFTHVWLVASKDAHSTWMPHCCGGRSTRVDFSCWLFCDYRLEVMASSSEMVSLRIVV